MLYNYSPSSLRKNQPSTVQYQSYTADKRATKVWLLIVAIVLLTLCIAALVIDFAVEHNWFYDSFNVTSTAANTATQINYGLWRLCFFGNGTCVSWFSSDSPFNYYIGQRLQQAQVGGINAWQALEIIFLFLSASTWIISVMSISCQNFRKNFHYYLSILSVFCIWPAVCVGISSLFVFGFSVYNVAVSPKGLDWCFYVNIAAVVLSIGCAIFLTVYALLLKRPLKASDSGTAIDIFTDLDSFEPKLNTSQLMAAKRDKKKRKKSYENSEMIFVNPYPARESVNTVPNTDYVTNPNHQMLAPYTSFSNNQHINPAFQFQQPLNLHRGPGIMPPSSANTIRSQSWHSPPSTLPYSYNPPYSHRPESIVVNYNGEPDNDYVQHGIYRPNQFYQHERTFNQMEEPRVLHYYTGYDQFTAVDRSPANNLGERYSAIVPSNVTAPFTVNSPYFQQNSY